MTRADRVPAGALAEMAQAMLERAAGGAVVIVPYVVEPAAIVLGSAQRLETIDAAGATSAGFRQVRRGSGGGAVICDSGMLAVDVALPPGHSLNLADVTESYRWLGSAWHEALAAIGVRTRPVEAAEARAEEPVLRAAARAACWAGRSPYELLTPDGRKLVGLAQRRRRGATLLQSAVACRGRQDRLLPLLRLPGAELEAAAAALERTVSLQDLLGPVAPAPDSLWSIVRPVIEDALRGAATGA